MKAIKSALAATGGGRVLLHMVCALRDHKWGWHLAGIKREFSR